MQSLENQNASQYPKFYYARHMVGGLCGYENEGRGRILIDAETMRKMSPSMNGKPIYNGAHDSNGYIERLENIKEKACGYVVDTFVNPSDGWLWSKMLIIDDAAHENILSGDFSVSNAYVPTQTGDGGMHNAIPYSSQVLDGFFTHIAIVPNPRYEQAKIYTPDEFNSYQEGKRQQQRELANSNNEEQKGSSKVNLKFFKTKQEEVSQVDADTSVELTNADGTTTVTTVEEMANAVGAARAAADAKAKADADAAAAQPQKIKVGDTEMTVQELVNAYQGLKAKDETDAPENANAGDGKKPDHFAELSNASANAQPGKIRVETPMTKLARGQALFGSGK